MRRLLRYNDIYYSRALSIRQSFCERFYNNFAKNFSALRRPQKNAPQRLLRGISGLELVFVFFDELSQVCESIVAEFFVNGWDIALWFWLSLWLCRSSWLFNHWAFLEILDGEADALAIFINFKNLDLNFLADGQRVFNLFNMFPGDLGDVDQTIYAVFQRNESAEWSDADNLAGEHSALRIFFCNIIPWVCDELLEGKADLALFAVCAENVNFDLITNADNVGRLFYAAPTHFRNVKETVYSAKIHECAEVCDTLYATFDGLTFFNVRPELFTSRFFFFFQHSAAGKDDLAVFWIWIKFNDLEAVGVAYKGFDVVNVFGVEMRCWHEAACTDIYDNAAFDIANNLRFDDFAVFKFLLKFIHSFFLISTLLGENHVTFVVFHLNDHNLNFIANFNDVFDIWIFLEGQLLDWNNAFGFATHVYHNFVRIDLYDGTGDYIIEIEWFQSTITLF